MLHHRRKLDRQGAREFADGHALLLLKTCQDCPARRVNERCESPVELRSLKLRHVVKYGGGSRFRQEESLQPVPRSTSLETDPAPIKRISRRPSASLSARMCSSDHFQVVSLNERPHPPEAPKQQALTQSGHRN